MNPWPGNYGGIVQLPRLGISTSGGAGGGGAGSPNADILIPFFGHTVWSLIANNNGGLGTYSGDNFSVSSTDASGSYTRALGTLNYTSAIPLSLVVRVTVSQLITGRGPSAGFFVNLDGVQIATVVVINAGHPPTLPVGLSVIPIGTATAGSHVITITGLNDIGQPSRLFTYAGGGGAGFACAFSALFQLQ